MTKPVISVITPCFDGAEYYSSYFESFRNQTANTDEFEVLIIDNGSSDAARSALIRKAADLGNFTVHEYAEQQGSYVARNYGVGQSSAEILAFVDIDCIPDVNWIETIIRYRADIVEGALLAGPINLFSAAEQPSLYERYDMLVNLNQQRYSRSGLAATANLAVSRAVFDSVNGFADVESGGDLDFCRRCVEHGHAVKFRSDLQVRHPSRADFASLASKERRKGRGIAALSSQRNQGWMGELIFIGRQCLGLIVQPRQFQLAADALRKYGLSADSLRLSWLIFRLGWIQRWAILGSTRRGQ